MKKNYTCIFKELLRAYTSHGFRWSMLYILLTQAAAVSASAISYAHCSVVAADRQTDHLRMIWWPPRLRLAWHY